MDSNVQTILDSFTESPAVEGDNYIIVITDKRLSAPGPTILFIAGDIQALTGYTSEELIGQLPRLLQGEGTDQAELTKLREVCERGDYYQGSLVNYRKDKTPFTMGLAISPIHVGGNIEYYFAIQSDVTGRDPVPMLVVIKERIDKIQEALASASLKLTNSVAKIGQLLAASIRYRQQFKVSTTCAPPPSAPSQPRTSALEPAAMPKTDNPTTPD